MLTRKQTRAAMLRKLADSGLTEKDATALGFTAVTAAELSAKPKLAAAVSYPAAGFVIPYYGVDADYTEFFRFRYLEQPARNGFAALTASKELRYTQPALAAPRVYFSPLYAWDKYLKIAASERQLFITEGENKANAACKLGLPTVALGGVWNFRSKREGQPVVPDLAELPLKDSVVYIVYDSDAVTNPDVLLAENALARQLLKLGARPYVVRLPALGKNKKTGLDDYLVSKGVAPFKKLTERAEEWRASRALHELNEEVIFLRESSTVLELARRHRWRATEFTNAVYANRTFTALEGSGDKAKMVEKRTAAEWLKWTGRAQVEGVTYQPGAPIIVNNEYNAWRGWGLRPELIKRGSVEPFRALLDFLFKNATAEARRWFEQWLAYPIQHPGAKLFQACVIWGPPGTGKTLIGHTLSRIYGTNYTEVNERELHAGFNEWAEYKQFALGDEITGGDKRAVADHLKGLITQKYLRINPKHIRPYTIPDCINWYFTSNHPDAFFIDDDDRRYFVHEVTGPPLERAFYKEYDSWYRSTAGASALFYYLLKLDLTGYDPMDPAPFTAGKREMIAVGRSEVGDWIARLKEDADAVLRDPTNRERVLARRLFTTQELYALYEANHANSRLTVNGLARELKRGGFNKALAGANVWTARGPQRLWIVRERTALGALKAEAYGKIYNQDIGTVGADLRKEKF